MKIYINSETAGLFRGSIAFGYHKRIVYMINSKTKNVTFHLVKYKHDLGFNCIMVAITFNMNNLKFLSRKSIIKHLNFYRPVPVHEVCDFINYSYSFYKKIIKDGKYITY